jgi:hypothetical protein
MFASQLFNRVTFPCLIHLCYLTFNNSRGKFELLGAPRNSWPLKFYPQQSWREKLNTLFSFVCVFVWKIEKRGGCKARERERESVCVYDRPRESACVCVCVFVTEREKNLEYYYYKLRDIHFKYLLSETKIFLSSNECKSWRWKKNHN